MIQNETRPAKSKHPMARVFALGFVYLGWLMIATGPIVALLALPSPISGVAGALVSALAGMVSGAFLVVVGETCVAVLELAEGRTQSRS